jgi:hypothetical protein
MSALNNLRRRLARINDTRPPSAAWGDLRGIERATKDLITQYGGLTLNPADQRTIEDAVRQYRESGRLTSFRDTKYVCFGCGLRNSDDDYCLLEDSSRFPGLLKQVDQFKVEPTKYRRCYQGLLTGYFEYRVTNDQGVAGSENWLMLRTYLDKHLSLLLKDDKPATWVQILKDHQNLLGGDPCSRYGEQMLSGDGQEFQAMCASLTLGERTWVHREIIMAMIRAGCQFQDVQFVSRIPRFVEMVTRYEELQDIGLAALLTRYTLISGAKEHVLLREMCIRRWGSPWLQKNEARWRSRVTAPVQQMVLGWLKRKWINDFFSLLQADHAADKRRLDFWIRYADEISDMHFALGRYAHESTNPDYRALRKELEGRLMSLTSNNMLNNAFLMCIGNYVFVEFGQQNNACHVFRRDQPMPFKLGQAKVSDTRRHLKDDSHPSHVMSLRHHDGHLSWEDNFKYEINKLTHSQPKQAAPLISSSRSIDSNTTQRPTTSITTNNPGSVQRFVMKHFSESALREMAADHKLDIDDHRTKNGNLWVRTDDKNPEVSRLLSDWGFNYKALKGWWKD